ncbi:MAG: hypothetical protein KDI71_03965 [Xanthomonadales bacterium]|nr:hypothetical protein [Xanthomonadales bacterium]
MLAATGNPNVPQADWPDNIGVYVPEWMRRKIKRDSAFARLEPFKRNRVYLESLGANDILLFRPGLLKEVISKASTLGAELLYSNWNGYLKDDSTLAVRQWLAEQHIPIHHIHTSGHASVSDLQRFAAAIAPARLVPIHSFHGDSFAGLFANVERRTDGEWWHVKTNQQGELFMAELKKKDAGYYLGRMTEFAQERASSANYDAASLAKNDRYIRIGGNGFRPISIRLGHPCGALPGVAGPVASFAKALAAAEREGDTSGSSGNAKPEHRLQAYLIRSALIAPDQLPSLLGCSDIFDELHFVTDELKLDEIRADLIFLARKEDRYFPVLMELKVSRQLKRLEEQLAAARSALSEHADQARAFMSAAVGGVQAEQIDMAQPCCVIVWPSLADPTRASTRVVEESAARRYFVEFPSAELDSLTEGSRISFSRGGLARSGTGRR